MPIQSLRYDCDCRIPNDAKHQKHVGHIGGGPKQLGGRTVGNHDAQVEETIGQTSSKSPQCAGEHKEKALEKPLKIRKIWHFYVQKHLSLFGRPCPPGTLGNAENDGGNGEGGGNVENVEQANQQVNARRQLYLHTGMLKMAHILINFPRGLP